MDQPQKVPGKCLTALVVVQVFEVGINDVFVASAFHIGLGWGVVTPSSALAL